MQNVKTIKLVLVANILYSAENVVKLTLGFERGSLVERNAHNKKFSSIHDLYITYLGLCYKPNNVKRLK